MKHDYVDQMIDTKIIEINNQENIYDVGKVIKVKDFIVEISGMESVMFYEKININNKGIGYVTSINEDSVTVAILKLYTPIVVGDVAYSTNMLYKGVYSPSSVGRIIDLFGEDKLSSKKFEDLKEIQIEKKTIPIMDRGTVNRPLLTGITGIDLMYPIGKGQRQLIIGDKRTGKTQIGLDTIVNQKNKNVMCFYVAIGKTKKEVKNIYFELAKRGALDYTTIVTAFNDELPPVISLIPYFALSVAEDYMMQGYDVLVVIDDLKRHAEAYREISLISGKSPGRDAYPADIFYTHSRLLEKGCQHKNGGSITILPIVETKGGDITDYISTNIISITDGQIVLSSKSFQKGEKPAINYGLSVSRLGGAVQERSMKAIGSIIRRKLLTYLETRSVYELVNTDEMSSELKNQFMEGKFILSNLGQYKFSPKSINEMIKLFGSLIDDNVVVDDCDESSLNSSKNQGSQGALEVNTFAVNVPQIKQKEPDVNTYAVNSPIEQQVPKESTPVVESSMPYDTAIITEQVPLEQPVPEVNAPVIESPVQFHTTIITEQVPLEQPVPEVSAPVVESSVPFDTTIITEQVPLEQPVPEVSAPVVESPLPFDIAQVPLEQQTPEVSAPFMETPVATNTYSVIPKEDLI